MARLMLESGPNKCINRSARIGFHMVTLSARRAPGYTHRYTSSEMSAVKIRRAKPRPHNLVRASIRVMRRKDVRGRRSR